MNCRRWAAAMAILLLAALVRLWGLGAQSLWMDEAFSHLFARLPLDVAWQAMIVDAVHPPLYYLLLRPWLALAGESEFALRLPSAAAGVLTVALIFRVGRAWANRQTAVWSALLLAVSPFHVWYSQEARMYALLGLLALGVLWSFWLTLRSDRLAVWGALAALSALAYVVHYFALCLPLIEFVFLSATFRRYHQLVICWTLVQALAALPLAAWLVGLYSIGGGTFGIGWIPSPRLDELLKTLWSFGMAYDGHVTLLVVVVALIGCGLLVTGLVCRNGQREARVFLLLALALPPIVTFLLSLRRPTYVDRFFIGSLPAFLLLATLGLPRLLRLAQLVACLVLVGVGLLGVIRFHYDPFFTKEAWRDVAAFVQAHERAGDALALRYFQFVVPFRYYYHGALELETVTFNQQTASLEELVAGHDRLWLVMRSSHTDPHHLAWSKPFESDREEQEPTVRMWMAEHSPADTFSFPGVMVMLFDARDKP